MVGAIVFSPIDAASQKGVVDSVQHVVVVRARTPLDAAVQHCIEYLGSKHPSFELEGSARSVVQFKCVLSRARTGRMGSSVREVRRLLAQGLASGTPRSGNSEDAIG